VYVALAESLTVAPVSAICRVTVRPGLSLMAVPVSVIPVRPTVRVTMSLMLAPVAATARPTTRVRESVIVVPVDVIPLGASVRATTSLILAPVVCDGASDCPRHESR
jgi:hypothetical protein